MWKKKEEKEKTIKLLIFPILLILLLSSISLAVDCNPEDTSCGPISQTSKLKEEKPVLSFLQPLLNFLNPTQMSILGLSTSSGIQLEFEETIKSEQAGTFDCEMIWCCDDSFGCSNHLQIGQIYITPYSGVEKSTKFPRTCELQDRETKAAARYYCTGLGTIYGPWSFFTIPAFVTPSTTTISTTTTIPQTTTTQQTTTTMALPTSAPTTQITTTIQTTTTSTISPSCPKIELTFEPEEEQCKELVCDESTDFNWQYKTRPDGYQCDLGRCQNGKCESNGILWISLVVLAVLFISLALRGR